MITNANTNREEQAANADPEHRPVANESAQAHYPIIWNGSFESDILTDAGPFEWSIGRSNYARLSIDGGASRGGTRSLRIDFSGRDTTRLDGELKQMIVVHRGAHYHLECYVHAEQFVGPEGPRIAVTSDSGPLAFSDPIAPGSYSWRLLAFDFIARQPGPSRAGNPSASQASSQEDSGEVAVWVSLVRKPKYSYDEPMRGRLWLDDFSIAGPLSVARGQ
jgi:hypothetical protein